MNLNLRESSSALKATLVLFLLLVDSSVAVHAHEPIYGLGPDMVPRGDFGYEVEIEGEHESHESHEGELLIVQELAYGLTPDFSFTLELELPFQIDEEASKFAEMGIRAKYRFYRKDYRRGTTQLAIIGGTTLPLETSRQKISSNSYGYLSALTGTISQAHWYLWGDLRYNFNTEEKSSFFYDLSIAWRPYIAEYNQVDFTPIIEVNGEIETEEKGSQLYISPGFLLSYKVYMAKGGVQFPIRRNGILLKRTFNWVFAAETHF